MREDGQVGSTNRCPRVELNHTASHTLECTFGLEKGIFQNQARRNMDVCPRLSCSCQLTALFDMLLTEVEG